MEAGIRYVCSDDGVTVAARVHPGGPRTPLLILSPALSSNVERRPVNVEPYVADRTVITADLRGSGLADRHVADMSVAARARDVLAILDQLELERVALLTIRTTTLVALWLVLEHPERVARVAAIDGVGAGADEFGQPLWQGLRALAESDWNSFTESMAWLAIGRRVDWARDVGERARLLRASMEPDDFLRLLDEERKTDVGPRLGSIAAPILAIVTTDSELSESTRAMVKALPNGRLAAGTAPYDATVCSFLSEGDADAGDSEASTLRIIVFTDIVAHTGMMARLGDAAGRQVLREHERITRGSLAEHGGREIKAVGDGFMATFGSAQGALRCAAALQRAFESPVAGEVLQVRMGINAGEPIEEGDDLFGASVITAARIAERAGGGQVLVSNVVRELVSGKGFLFSDTGEHLLKGLEEGVRIWEFQWRGRG